MTWLELSATLKEGDRVKFTKPYENYPTIMVLAGELATVVENSLNEKEPTLYLRPDNAKLEQDLHEWDGVLHVYGPWHVDQTWQDEAPLAKVEDATC